MSQSEANPCYWLSRLSERLFQFQTVPSKATQCALMLELNQYQKQVADGLNIPKTVPAPLREAKNYSDWYRRLLDEAMAMFKINPSENRMTALVELLNSYLDAVITGRVKP